MHDSSPLSAFGGSEEKTRSRSDQIQIYPSSPSFTVSPSVCECFTAYSSSICRALNCSCQCMLPTPTPWSLHPSVTNDMALLLQCQGTVVILLNITHIMGCCTADFYLYTMAMADAHLKTNITELGEIYLKKSRGSQRPGAVVGGWC